MYIYTFCIYPQKKKRAVITLSFGWNVGLAQREAQIAARETSKHTALKAQIVRAQRDKNLGLRALTSTDFLYSGSSAKILADSTGV